MTEPLSPESRRKLTVTGLVAALLLGTATTATATNRYCGHGIDWGWTARTHYVYAKPNPHRHVMQRTGHLSATSTYYVCTP